MAIHTETAIYKAALDLTRLSSQLVAQMPRNHRAVDGALLVGNSRALLKHVRRANMATDKIPHIDALLERLADLQTDLRVCTDLRLITQRNFSKAAALSISVGKQAGGWKKKSASRPDSWSSRQS
ncbi:MAG: four helix bundle protein [Janthinobacterium lividum]